MLSRAFVAVIAPVPLVLMVFIVPRGPINSTWPFGRVVRNAYNRSLYPLAFVSPAERVIGLVDLRNGRTAANDHRLVVAQSLDCGIPARRCHVRPTAPGRLILLCPAPVENVGLHNTVECSVLVPAGHQHSTVS